MARATEARVDAAQTRRVCPRVRPPRCSVGREVAAIPLAWYAHPYIYADDVAQFPVTDLGKVMWEAVSLDAPS